MRLLAVWENDEVESLAEDGSGSEGEDGEGGSDLEGAGERLWLAAHALRSSLLRAGREDALFYCPLSFSFLCCFVSWPADLEEMEQAMMLPPGLK